MPAPGLDDALEELGWTDADLARFLRLGKNGDRTVRRWREDKARRGVPGPVQVAVELKLAERKRAAGAD